MDVRDDATLGDDDMAEQLAKLFVVPKKIFCDQWRCDI